MYYLSIVFAVIAVLIFIVIFGKDEKKVDVYKDSDIENFSMENFVKLTPTPKKNKKTDVFSNTNIELMKSGMKTPFHELEGLTIEDIARRTSIQDTTFDNKLFDPNYNDPFNKTIYYTATEFDGIDSGIKKCLDNCDGNCLEYGLTGNAWCFPKTKNLLKD